MESPKECMYVFGKYDFPLPNDGDKYNLTEQELVTILDHVYDCGYEHGKQAATPIKTTASAIEDIDDPMRWREMHI